MSSALLRVASARYAVLALAAVGAVALPRVAHADTTSTISGSAFADTDRNGVRGSGEAGRAGDVVYLMTGDGSSYVASATTDGNGYYAFTNVAAGSYLVEYDPSTWYGIRNTLVPTSTGSVRPELHVTTPTSTSVSFGWRPISTSTTIGSPISSYRGTDGALIESYTDAVDARTIHDDLASTGAMGAEAPKVTVRFGYGSTNVTNSGWQQLSTGYGNYNATSYVSYTSWMDEQDATLFHEYGHAWSGYFAAIVQQDPTMSGYLRARGLADDSRVDSEYGWSRQELIAEDFRQLFGTTTAQARAQANGALPAASTVPSLYDYLSTTFRTAPAGGSAAATTAPAPLTVSTPSVTPLPVKTKATISWSASDASTTTLKLMDSSGKLVRTLINAVAKPSGTSSAAWDRLDSAGRKVRSGTYTAIVSLTTSDGRTATASTAFSVS